MCKRVIRACCYKEHFVKKKKKKKKRKEKREKDEKWDLCFIQKSYMYMYREKSGNFFAIFLLHGILGLDLQFKPLFFNFFLWYGKDYLKHML